MDELLDEILPHAPAVALEGAKGVGKTATAVERAATVVALDDPRQREVLVADPDYVTTLPAPVLIDEWQLEPSIWDRVRRSVDADSTGGRFLLTGSAAVGPEVRIHSGAGRILSLPMRPMTFAERGLEAPAISISELLQGHHPEVTGRSEVDLSTYTDEILRSGFPGIRNLLPRVRDLQLDSYIARIVERELPEQGISIKRPAALRAWLAAYGAATSTDASYTAILDAATPGESEKPARQTATIYRDHLQRIFVLDPVPAWSPAFAPLKRLTKTPKHHLVDPALAARLVGVGKAGLLRGEGTRVSATTGSWLGALFESLVTQCVRVCADAANARVGHLRTKDTEHEIDLVVEGEDHRVLAVEVKLAATVDDKDVRHLNWLQAQLGDRLADRLVITTGTAAYRRQDGVAVAPLALIGP